MKITLNINKILNAASGYKYSMVSLTISQDIIKVTCEDAKVNFKKYVNDKK